MKKFIVTILTFIAALNVGLALMTNPAFAEADSTQKALINNQNVGQNLQGRISLPDALHPDNSPDVKMAVKEDNGFEAAYGNFFLQLIAGGLLYLAGPTAVGIIAIGGIRYVVSHGDQSMMDGAKKTITYGIIGLLIVIFSFAIVKAIIGIVVGI